jgi:dimethylhistidine N-methyltransferase
MPDDSALISAAASSVATAALAGLLGQPKTLPPALFYDEAGCRLFAQITDLPEYYLTRTERALLAEVAPEVLRSLTEPTVLVEYGASDEAKAEFLLDVKDRNGESVIRAYVPIDVAAPALQRMSVRLHDERPYLQVYPLVADFTAAVVLPADLPSPRLLGFFPGSTIGNLDPAQAQRFLQRARDTLGAAASFLVGVDLRKDPDVLLPAYDDAAGITAAFNRNLLVRLNREAGADFDPASFAHRAVWNDAESRIEMHLVSLREQAVRVDGHVVHFASGETIHTENSYKYTPERFAALAHASGWHTATLWTDPAQRFSLHLLEPRRGP